MKVVAFRSLACLPIACLMVASASLTACSEASDTATASTYQAWADKVATIPLTPQESSAVQHPTQVSLPLDQAPDRDAPRPALKVELLSPHQLWDLRDGPLKVPSIEVAEGTTAPVPVQTAAPITPTVTVAPVTSRPSAEPVVADGTGFRTVQLGAFSNEQAARSAWTRLTQGASASALSGLMPQFEPAEVSGRQLVRLRVSAREDRVQQLCQTVAASDPWCIRAGSTAVPSTIFH